MPLIITTTTVIVNYTVDDAVTYGTSKNDTNALCWINEIFGAIFGFVLLNHHDLYVVQHCLSLLLYQFCVQCLVKIKQGVETTQITVYFSVGGGNKGNTNIMSLWNFNNYYLTDSLKPLVYSYLIKISIGFFFLLKKNTTKGLP